MSAPRRFPALFHRVFLSHLLVLAIAFVSALILLDYLFVDGISHFLVHTPVILIPVLLALIGLVGLLALWTAGAAAVPLDRTVDAINDVDPERALERLLPESRIDEIAQLIGAMQHRLKRETARRPMFLRVDALLNVRDCDIDTAARLGFTPDEIRRTNLRMLLAAPADVAVAREAALRAFAEEGTGLHSGAPRGDAPREITLHFRGAAARVLPARCLLYQLPGDETLIIGFAGKVL